MKFGYRFRIIVIGCGATGSHLVGLLSQLAMYEDKIKDITLIDNDIIEPKNLKNQRFNKSEVGINKARALSDRYSKLDIPIHYVDKKINVPDDLFELWTGGHYLDTILISCVDNDKARAVLHEIFCDHFKYPGVLAYIDTGNGDERTRRGQTILGVRIDDNVYSYPVAHYYPEILEAKDEEANLISCDQVNVSKPQHLAVNLLSATTVFLLVNNIINNSTIESTFYNFNANEISIKGENLLC